MKNLTLIDGQWKQRVIPQLTEQEKALLRGTEQSDARKNLMERIRSESLAAATPEDAAAVQAIYDQHKIEGADFIAADITLPSGEGIINCRVNNKHQQIRF
jgi:hypothetical protein